jgi:hypothetical protein
MQEGLSWIYNVLLAPRHHYSDQYDQIWARVTPIFGAFIAASAVLSLVGIFVAQGTSSIIPQWWAVWPRCSSAL